MTMISDTLNYILNPINESDIKILRNVVLCGIVAFAILIIGVKYLITLVFYMMIVTVVIVVAWLYTLNEHTRTDLVNRTLEVCRTFVRKCISDVIKEVDSLKGRDNSINGKTSSVKDEQKIFDGTEIKESEVDDTLDKNSAKILEDYINGIKG